MSEYRETRRGVQRRRDRWQFLLIISSGLLAIVIGYILAAHAEQSSGFYSEWARRGLVVSTTGLADSTDVDTLIIADVGGQEASGVLVDSTREEHHVGSEYWTLMLRARNPLSRCDSLYWHFYSEAGNGPATNPDGSSTLIAADSTNDRFGVWGVYRFPTQDTTVAYRFYRIPIPRGRGTIYIMGRFLHTPSRWICELWKGSDR